MTVYIPSPNVAMAAIRPAPWAGAVRIAAFSCRGLEALSRQLGFRVAVVAAVADADRHRERLRDLWYASGVARPYAEWPLPVDFDNWDFREWSKVAIDSRWFGGRPHPLAASVVGGDLLLRLPAGSTPRAFAVAFQACLADLRFEAVARRPAHLVRSHHARRPVAVSSRYARASTTSDTPVEVRDVIHFGPRTLRRVADAAFAAMGASARCAPIGHPYNVVAP